MTELFVETNVQNWEYKVPIEKTLADKNPFPNIPSKLASALILGLYGRRSTVCRLMQKLSKQSRAYIVKQDGLQGFTVIFHTNVQSALFELLSTRKFILPRSSINPDISPQQVLLNELIPIKSHADKLLYLKQKIPKIYLGTIKLLGQK